MNHYSFVSSDPNTIQVSNAQINASVLLSFGSKTPGPDIIGIIFKPTSNLTPTFKYAGRAGHLN